MKPDGATPMAEAVLFDFGGTLDSDGRPWCERLFRGYREAGGRLGLAAFEASFQASDRMLAERPGVTQFGFQAMVTSQVQLLQGLLPDVSAVDTVGWVGRFVAETHEVVKRNLPLLSELGQRFELGIIANFTGNLRPCLAELGIEDCFAVVFDSGVVGLRKPDRRLFAAAFDSLGRLPEQCLMVGDNPFFDIAPAHAMGCATCWLTPAERPFPPGITSTKRIQALSELKAFLA